jgi:hypothetical protein
MIGETGELRLRHTNLPDFEPGPNFLNPYRDYSKQRNFKTYGLLNQKHLRLPHPEIQHEALDKNTKKACDSHLGHRTLCFIHSVK